MKKIEKQREEIDDFIKEHKKVQKAENHMTKDEIIKIMETQLKNLENLSEDCWEDEKHLLITGQMLEIAKFLVEQKEMRNENE